MTMYRVKVFKHAIWDGENDRKVEADSPLEAAIQICGPDIVERGQNGLICAQVSPIDKPDQKTMFSEKP